MKLIRQNKGFTMIELVVVIAIMGIVFTSVSSFLVSNLKTFNRAEDQIDVQHNAQIAMNEIVQNTLEAEGIESIKTHLSTNTVKSIKFKFNIGGSVSYIQYDYNKDSHILSKGKGNDKDNISTTKYAENITDFVVEDDGRSAKFYITTNINGYDVKLENQVSFRNAEK